MVCVGGVPNQNGFTQDVSTEPFPVCGSVRCESVKKEELLDTYDLGILIGTDRRGVTEKIGGMAGNIGNEMS